MAQTLLQILNDIAAYVDQDTTLATGTELATRVNLINQSLVEWGNAYQWSSLRVPFTPSYALSATSMGLPVTFKKLMSPLVDNQTRPGYIYPEIKPDERFSKESSSKYCYILGDESIGKYLTINPAITSGVSLSLDMQSYPSSMATLQDTCVCPQPLFISKRVSALILEARSDSRFPVLKQDAQNLLRTMVEEEDAKSGGMNNATPSLLRQNHFRIGRD